MVVVMCDIDDKVGDVVLGDGFVEGGFGGGG